MSCTHQGIANNIKNTKTYERSVLAGVTNVVFRSAEELQWSDGLVGRQGPLLGCPGVVCSDRMQAHTLDIARGDVVARGGQMGVVRACVRQGSALGVLVETTTVRRRLASHSVVVSCTNSLQAWSSRELVPCIAWKAISASDILVVCQ